MQRPGVEVDEWRWVGEHRVRDVVGDREERHGATVARLECIDCEQRWLDEPSVDEFCPV